MNYKSIQRIIIVVILGGITTSCLSFSQGKRKHETLDFNSLKFIGLALHNFNDVNRMLPIAVEDCQLSWRVLVLPHIGYGNETLDFEKFKLDEPWDSPNNKLLIQCEIKDEILTLSNGHLVSAIQHEIPPKRLSDIVDGTQNTVFAFENPSLNGDQWTQKNDPTVEQAVELVKSLNKGEYLLALLFDGSTAKILSPAGKDLRDDQIASIFDYKDGLDVPPGLLE